MLRELLAAWRGTDPLKEMYEKLVSMIEAGKSMFETSWTAAAQGAVDAEIKTRVYRRDIEVNRTERAIRRRIAEHLVTAPGTDVPASLVLMSVVKDAERIGDYCKNLLEAAEMEDAPIGDCPFFESYTKIVREVVTLFDKTRTALTETDTSLAGEVVTEERDIAQLCDALVERLASQELPSRKAVPWALSARYLKRVAAHLGNIASSLVMPLHKLDYYDEKWLPGEGPATE